MIFVSLTLLWVLYILKAPFWAFAMLCLGAICSFKNEKDIADIKTMWTRFIEITDKGLNDIMKIMEEKNGKKVQNTDNAES